MECHVPLIFDERQALTEEVSRRRMSALRECSLSIQGRLAIEELAQFACRIKLAQSSRQYSLSKASTESMLALCQLQGWGVPEKFTFSEPLHPAVLIHWRMMLGIVACMPPAEGKALKEAYPELGPPIRESLPLAFDAHFHLDRTRKKCRKVTVETIVNSMSPGEEFQVQVAGGIAVFCDPATYPTETLMAELTANGFGVAIGLHPKSAQSYGDREWEAFERSLALPGVKALGEVGLDYSVPPGGWIAQIRTLDRAVKSLRPEQVLVLHCRPQESVSADTILVQVLFQIKGVVPREQRIHLHCYFGSIHTVELWLAEFPNTLFGFVRVPARSGSNLQKECIAKIAEDRILLETDSPYFSGNRPFSSPALLGLTAEYIASIRGQEWTHVLQVASNNARSLYGM